MHIREITISGIRSLADVRLTFKKGSNVIVGDNGTGKSNILFAIQLVMCADQFTLSHRERQALLHRVSARQRRNVGFVEIVIDNSDYRIPCKERFIPIRHTISEAEDWYSVNGKNISKSAVKCMWKFAGLSGRNPFYILNQGKVASLMEGGSERRLTLLNDLIGFSENESNGQLCKQLLTNLRKMEDAIEEQFNEMTDKCKKLILQIDAFRRFETAENNVNAIELVMYERNVAVEEENYTLLKSDYKRQENDLLQIEENLNICIEESEMLEENLKAKQKELNSVLAVIEVLKNTMVVICSRLDSISAEGRSAMIAHNGTTAEKRVDVDKLDIVECNIVVAEKLLKKLIDESEKVKASIDQGNLELVRKITQKKALNSQKEQITQYRSREERDQHINEEIKRCNSSNLKYNRSSMEINESMLQCDADIMASKSKFDHWSEKLESYVQRRKCLEDEHETIVIKISQYNTRKEAMKNRLMTIREHINKFEGDLFKGDFKAYLGIMDIIKEWVDDGTLGEQYHGLLVEKIKCGQMYNTAVDVVANKRLLFHIVETDAFATRLTKRFNDKRLRGTLNLIALNRVPHKHFDHRAINPRFATPLLQYLQYDQKYDKIMNFIFGNVLICVDEKHVAPMAKTNRANCVLLDGTYCSLKGALSGGYFSPRTSKMNVQVKRKDLQHIKADLENQLTILTSDIIKLTGMFDRLSFEIPVLCSKITDREMMTNLKRHEEECQELIDTKKDYARELYYFDTLIAKNNERISCLHRKLSSDFLNDLPQDLLDHLLSLYPQIEELEGDIALWSSELTDLQNRIKITSKMFNDSKKEREDLLQNARDIITPVPKSVIPQALITVEHKPDTDDIEEKLKQEYYKLQNVNSDIAKIKEMLETAEVRCFAMRDKRDEAFNLHMKTECKMKICKTQIAYYKLKVESVKKIVKVAFYDPYKDYTKQELLETAEGFRNEVRTMNPRVNRRALEMHRILQQQRDMYRKNLNRIVSSKMVFVQYLDEYFQGAGAVISLTYDQIKARFQERFQSLVPGSKGTITIQKNNAEFVGVDICVSFGRRRQTQQLNQLSGSQKTLITLAFLFSIHAIEHTPIYMFDEVDANLDSSYAKVVATQIQQLSTKAQFIMATLKHDLVKVANRCFGVIARNGVSRICQITTQQAFGYLAIPSPPRMQLQFDEDD